jgi:hypothetical protein
MYNGLIIFAAFLVIGVTTLLILIRRMNKAEKDRYTKIK